jgi:hypothetical protein
VTERRTLGDLDFDYGVDESDDNDGWYGRALVADPTPPDDAGELAPEDLHAETWDTPDDTARWHPQAEAVEPLATRELDDPPRTVPRHLRRDDPEDTQWTGILAPRNGRHGVAPTTSWQSKLANSGAWDFKASAANPWYRSKRVLTAAGGAAVAALVLAGVLLLLRGSAAGVQETSVSPTNPPSAEPAPSSPAPALSTAIAPPPPLLPPPPPPTSAQQITPPAPTRGYTPRRSAPPQSDMPEIGVTRTPVTRAPMSATPPPPPSPDRNSSKPGDAPKGGWGPW